MLIHMLSTGYPTAVIRYTLRSTGTMQAPVRFFDIDSPVSLNCWRSTAMSLLLNDAYRHPLTGYTR